jgi:hypothetical protein|tara:strand:- start:92 stop:334 length:243 start_codon:yes stop_codon:yes gene_type:complete
MAVKNDIRVDAFIYVFLKSCYLEEISHYCTNQYLTYRKNQNCKVNILTCPPKKGPPDSMGNYSTTPYPTYTLPQKIKNPN